MTDILARLAEPMEDGAVRLEPLTPDRYPALREACAADPDIWEIYPVNMTGEDFDAAMEARTRFHDAGRWVTFAALEDGKVVGLSSYIDVIEKDRTLEIGGTYIAPSVRGGPFNATMKRLMIERAIDCGFTRIEFRIDTRNQRSMAAVAKLGATHEGTLRRNRITWTGYVRDTAIYSILAEEWPKTS